jgi:hypothetical protein
MHVNGFINFTAIKLDGNSFLAQGIDKGYKKGVFFEIRENNKIVATAARYCALRICQNRHGFCYSLFLDSRCRCHLYIYNAVTFRANICFLS